MLVFPEPRLCTLTSSSVCVNRGVNVRLGERAGDLERHSASLIEDALTAGTGLEVVIGAPATNDRIKQAQLAGLEDVANRDQGYVLSVDRDCITIAAHTETGVFYGTQTLLQMIEREGESRSIPCGTIVDWPDRKYRGIFVESRWCSDMMKLDDWKRAIDLLASLKFNVLNIGIENCWMIQYEGKRSEFLLVPIKKYPELRTPQSVEYYSAKKGDYVRLEYLPPMFEEDFFGDVVAYGASRGVTVYPHFNSPGHNTLIPHKIPEISARDEHGQPTGFGFCLSNPKTYEVMFGIVDEIADRYLLPNGVRWFHLGQDEVWPILGMDESEPSRVVSPHCQCEECRKRDWYDSFVDYCVKLSKHLVDKGFEKVHVWHDSFVRGGRMNQDLADRLKREGLIDKIDVHWWRYSGFFDTLHPELGMTTWVVPITGYYYWTPLQDHLNNIYLATKKAAEESVEGAESYTIFYNAYFRNYACLSEYSWNPDGVGDVKAFRAKYTQFLFGDREEGREAFERFDFVTGPLGPTSWTIYHYSYAYALNRRAAFMRANYPQAIVEQLWDNPGGIWHNLGLICENARAAKRVFENKELWRSNPAGLSGAYSAEMARTAATAHVFLRLAQAVRAWRDLREDNETDANALGTAADALAKAIKEMDEAIAAIEDRLDHYMGPSMIRELTMQRRFACAFLDEINGVVARIESGELAALPEIECLRTHEVRWVGKAHKGD